MAAKKSRSGLWGISFTAWHFLLALLATLVVAISVLWFFDSWFDSPSVRVAAAILLSFVVWSYLHALNESWQAVDSKLIDKYGSLENFQKDSRSDWEAAFWGWIVGVILSLSPTMWILF